MATHYLYGTILTNEAVAANNRGDNLGNTTTLQKVFHQDDLHTSVSAEAIRFAFRYRFQLKDYDSVNRTYDFANGEPQLNHKDEKRTYWWSPKREKVYIDDDLMGFMDAEAAAMEKDADPGDDNETETQKPDKKNKKPKGKAKVRQSPLAIGRAISLRPYRGEISFNCVSGKKEKGQPSLYNAEMHTTEYQYAFGINLVDVVEKAHIGHLIDAIIDPPQVAGNHSRFAYDFSPASIILRVTNAHSSRIQNCFEHDAANQTYTFQKLIQRVEAGDIPPSELIIGGDISHTEEGQRLKELKVTMFSGVYAAANEARKRIAVLGDEYKVITPTEAIAGGVA